MFLDLPDPCPLLFCLDPDLDPSINKKKSKKTLISTILLLLFDFSSKKTDVNLPSKSNKQKNLASCQPVTKKQDPDPDPYQNFTDTQHCCRPWIKKPFLAGTP